MDIIELKLVTKEHIIMSFACVIVSAIVDAPVTEEDGWYHLITRGQSPPGSHFKLLHHHARPGE